MIETKTKAARILGRPPPLFFDNSVDLSDESSMGEPGGDVPDTEASPLEDQSCVSEGPVDSRSLTVPIIKVSWHHVRTEDDEVPVLRRQHSCPHHKREELCTGHRLSHSMPRRESEPMEINKIRISRPSPRLHGVSPRSSGSGFSKGSSSGSSSPDLSSSTLHSSLQDSLHTSHTFSDLREVIMADADDEEDGNWSWRGRRQRRLTGSTESSPRVSPRGSFCESASLAEEDEDAKFHVRFFNKFGRKGAEEEAFKDACCVSHVYKDSVLITDTLNNKVVLFKRSGRPKRAFLLDEGCEPFAATVTPRGYVATTVRRYACVTVWSGRGVTMNEFGSDVLRSPAGLAVDSHGRYIVADEGANKVFVFSPTGELLTSIGESDPDVGTFNQPRYVCCSASGRIVVSDSGNHCIKVFDSTCKFLFQFGRFGTKDGEFKFPYGVCTDQTGNIVVADYFNDRVSLFSPEGVFIQHLVTSQRGLKRPRSVSIRCAHNRKLFITHGGVRATEVVVYKLIALDSKYTVAIKSDV